jgi:hypothetical protein
MKDELYFMVKESVLQQWHLTNRLLIPICNIKCVYIWANVFDLYVLMIWSNFQDTTGVKILVLRLQSTGKETHGFENSVCMKSEAKHSVIHLHCETA